MDDDLASLQAKLKTYGEQMAQVEALIQQDPANQEWLKLRADITEVMQLTREYVKIKRQETPANQSRTNAEPQTIPANGIAADSQYNASAAGVTATPLGWKPAVGQPCEARFDKRWYPVHVTAAHEEEAYSVIFYTHNNSEVVEGVNLRPLQNLNPSPIDKGELEAGQTCQALFAADSKWYNAKIDSVSDRGVSVTFLEYGNKEEVPFPWIRLAVSVKDTKKQKRKAKRDGIIAIPSSLHILPTDSEAEKKRKHKRVKMIKNKNRTKILEVERKKKQTSWLKFHKKTRGKRISGSMNSLRKGSIFASPDSLEGRVGVTGSGQGMTEFKQRKKYRLNHGAAAASAAGMP